MADREEPEELLPLEGEAPGSAPDYQLLDVDCIKAFIRNDQHNPFPCVLLDSDLAIAGKPAFGHAESLAEMKKGIGDRGRLLIRVFVL